jgi:ligand-binding SRPBCC domain-containing protein
MRVHVLQREQRLPAAPDAVFPFFADAANLEAITPPLLRFRVVTPGPIEMGAGTFIQYALRLRGLPVRWDTLIESW